MGRLLVLLALAVAPLMASAHQGHREVATEADAPSIVAVAAAASRCPGGGHENCCCHDGWCTTTPASVVVIDAPSRKLPLPGGRVRVSFHSDPALPSAALLHFSPRGPPPLS